MNTETREDIMPTTCVRSRGDGFVATPINAPIMMTHQESEKCIITVRFNEEPDIILTWENPHVSIPWDYRVVEVVAVMDLYCIRADQIWTGTIDKTHALAKISEMLVQAGFKLWA